MRSLLSQSEIGQKGIEELEFINNQIVKLGLKSAILDLDITLARGLNYYTAVFLRLLRQKE
ncbi:histidyl-tRNA synthetase [Nonlabens ulvanivorans]|nr:histidyl-tRNA synthetase [Nonlabens ulvanivorans]